MPTGKISVEVFIVKDDNTTGCAYYDYYNNVWRDSQSGTDIDGFFVWRNIPTTDYYKILKSINNMSCGIKVL